MYGSSSNAPAGLWICMAAILIYRKYWPDTATRSPSPRLCRCLRCEALKHFPSPSWQGQSKTPAKDRSTVISPSKTCANTGSIHSTTRASSLSTTARLLAVFERTRYWKEKAPAEALLIVTFIQGPVARIFYRVGQSSAVARDAIKGTSVPVSRQRPTTRRHRAQLADRFRGLRARARRRQ